MVELLVGPPLRDAVPGEQITFAVPKAGGVTLGTIEALDYLGLINPLASAVERPPIDCGMFAVSVLVHWPFELVEQSGHLSGRLTDIRTGPGVIVTATITRRNDRCLMVEESLNEPSLSAPSEN